MEKTVGAFEARRQIGPIIKDVAGKGDRYLVDYHGESVVAVVPMDLYERWTQQREAFFDRLEEMAATADLSSEEADDVAAQAVRAVRRSSLPVACG